MRKTALMAAVCLLSMALAGCGGGGGGNQAEEANYAASRTVVDALASDRKLDQAARDTIAGAVSGAVPFQQTTDTLAAQTRELLALIEEVASSPRAKNQFLTRAQERLATYLRERVFQIESTLGAQSPQEAQAIYDGAKANLDKVRDDVRGMLFEYDDTLKNSVP